MQRIILYGFTCSVCLIQERMEQSGNLFLNKSFLVGRHFLYFEYLPIDVHVFYVKYIRVERAPTGYIRDILHSKPTIDWNIWKIILQVLKHLMFLIIISPKINIVMYSPVILLYIVPVISLHFLMRNSFMQEICQF